MNQAWHYRDGQWDLGNDPIRDLQDTGEEVTKEDIPFWKALHKLGFRRGFTVENKYSAGFTLWEHISGVESVIVTGTDSAEDDLVTRYWYANAPDAREICARWATLARDVHLASVLFALDETDFFSWLSNHVKIDD